IRENAALFADFGEIRIAAVTGQADSILTKADGDGAGLATIGSVKTETIVTSNTDVAIKSGVKVTNIFGDVTIEAYTGSADIQTVGDYSAGGIIAVPKSRAFVADIILNAAVKIASEESDKAGAPAEITAKNIYIQSGIKNLSIFIYTYAITKGLGGSAEAESKAILYINADVHVSNAILKAYDALYIKADATPTSPDLHVNLYAGTKIQAFAGRIESYARLFGSAVGTVKIGALADFTGADVRLESRQFNGRVHLDASGTRHAIASKVEETKNEMTSGSSLTVDQAVVFHIGDAAAGIAIDVYKDEWGMVQVRSVGMPNERLSYGFGQSGNQMIFITVIRNNGAGKLTALGVDLSQNKIYGQQYIPEIDITNRTGYDIVLSAIDPYNESFTKPAVNSAGYNTAYFNVSAVTRPVITIESRDAGDITFNGIVSNERGSVIVTWTEENGNGNGSLYTNNTLTMGSVQVAAVWTHAFKVVNAANIGTGGMAQDGSDRFQIYLNPFEGNNIEPYITATGYVYLQMTLAEITPVKELTQVGTGHISGTLDLNYIVAGGDLDILLPTAIRMQYLVDAGAASLVIPGVLEFTTETISASNINLTLAQLEFYLLGVQEQTYNIYELPTGVKLYLDESGNIHRVIGIDGKSFDTENYGYTVSGGQIIILLKAYNAELNLATGVLTAKDEKGFDVYLEYDMDSNSWHTVAGTVVMRNEFTITSCDDNDNYETISLEQCFLYRTDSDGNKYYFLNQEGWDNRYTISYGGKYYMMIVDKAGYLIGVFEGARANEEYRNGSVVHTTSDSDVAAVIPADKADYNETKTRTHTWTMTDSNFLGTGGTYYVEWYRYDTVTTTYTWDEKQNKYVVKEEKITKGSQIYLKEASYGGYDYYNKYWVLEHPKYIGMHIAPSYLIDADGNSYVSIQCSGILFNDMDAKDIKIGDEEYTGYQFGDKKDGTYRAVLFAPVSVLQEPIGQKQYQLDSVNVTIEIQRSETSWTDPYGIFSCFLWITVKADAKIHLLQNESVTLKLHNYSGTDVTLTSVYRVLKDMWISSTGEVIVNTAADVTGMGSFITYKPQTGNLRMEGFFYNKEGSQSPVVVLSGNLKLARISENVAYGADGKYYYWDGDRWWVAKSESIMTRAIGENIRVTYNGQTVLTITTEGDTTYYTTYENGEPVVKVGSDFNVTWLIELTESTTTAAIPGTEYLVTYIEGQNVKLKMDDPAGSILDGDPFAEEDVDIKSNGNIIILAESTGTIGQGNNLIDMVLPDTGKVELLDLDENKVIAASYYIYVPEESMELDPGTLIKNGATLLIVTKDGSIIGTDLTVQDGASVIFKTNKLEVLDADGKPTGFIDNTDAISEGDIKINKIYVDKGTGQTGSSIDFEAAGDILFDMILSKASSVKLDADGSILMYSDGIDCGEYGKRNLIKFAEGDTDSTASLWMRAGKDIGTSEKWLILDVPAEVTVQIGDVTSYYLDALELTYTNEAGTETLTHGDDPKINEFFGYTIKDEEITGEDQPLEGDHLKWIEDEELQIAIQHQSWEEIATWIMERKAREEWTADLEKAVIAQLIKAGNEEGLNSQWLLEIISDEAIIGMLSILDADSVDALISAAEAIDNEEAMKAILSEEELRELLAGTDNLDEMTYAQMLGQLPKNKLAALALHLTDETDKTKTRAETIMESLTTAAAANPEGDEAEAIVEALLAAICHKETVQIIDENGEPQVDEDNDPKMEEVYAISDEEAAKLLIYFFTETERINAQNQTAAQDPTTDPNIDPAADPDGQTPELELIKDLGAYLAGLLTDEEIQELYYKALNESRYSETETSYTDSDPRDVNIHIGESAGAANVYNDGAINITQDTGDITIGYIRSEREDVTLTASGGSILADKAIVADPQDPAAPAGAQTEHILGRNIKLEAKDSIGSVDKPLILEQRSNGPEIVKSIDESIYEDPDDGTKSYALVRDAEGNWVLDVKVRYDWIRTDDAMALLRLDAKAETGSIYIEEETGEMGLGIVEAAAGTVSLISPESITDLRTEQEATEGKRNITAKILHLTAEKGQIGQQNVRIYILVHDNAVLHAAGDIFIDAQQDLTVLSESIGGKVYIDTERNLTLTTSAASAEGTGNLVLGLIRVGGTADITATGTAESIIVEGPYTPGFASIQADNLIINTSGSFGTEGDLFQIDTAAGSSGQGTLKVTAAGVFAEEISGDLVLLKIQADAANEKGNSVKLVAPGSILSAAGNSDAITDAADAQKEAFEAQAKADQADSQAGVYEKDAQKKEDEYQARQKEADDAKALADQAKDALQQAQLSAETAENAVDDSLLEVGEINRKRAEILAILADSALSEEEKAQRIAALGYGTLAELDEQLRIATALLETNQKALAEAQQAALAAQKAYDAANMAAEAAKTIASEAERIAGEAKILAEAARAKADTLQQEATNKAQSAIQKRLDALNADTVITAPGNVILIAGDSIGRTDHSLSIDTEGTITALGGKDSNDQVGIATKKQMVIDPVSPGAVRLASLEGISSTTITADSVKLEALHGSLGTQQKPMVLTTDQLDALAVNTDVGAGVDDADDVGNIFINNTKALTIGSVFADGDVTLNVAGPLSALPTDDDEANIMADNLKITATGDIGSSSQPVSIAANQVTMQGQNIDASFITNVLVNTIKGKDITLTGDGNIIGNPEEKDHHITGDNLIIRAFGDVGDPMRLWISGTVDITSQMGEVNVVNEYYVPVVETEVGRGVRTGDASDMSLPWMLALLSLLTMALLTLTRRREQKQ
ncbi:MAG: hypothetical protein Q4C25_03600, partial [Bacillota bacterium]|nr:hypothetical protein [Bacillota bacterium]